MRKRSAESPTETMRRLRTKIQTESAEIAIVALTEVAADKNAPAPARATAGAAIMRAAGLFERGEANDLSKPPSEMSMDEIQARLAEVRAEIAESKDGVLG